MKSSGYPHLDVFAFSALFRPLFFISMVSTSCHLQTMRANVNFPHVHFCARGAMHGSDPEGERVAQTEGVGRGTLGIYIRQCDWVVLIDLSFPSKPWSGAKNTVWELPSTVAQFLKIPQQMRKSIASYWASKTLPEITWKFAQITFLKLYYLWLHWN